MKLDTEVKREIKEIAIGSLVCTIIVIAVFAVIGRFDYTVLIGGAVGFSAAFLNFCCMSVSVVRALETGDEVAAKLKLRSSYITRTLGLVAIIAVAIAVDFINFVPVLLSVFYPRITITACNIWNTYNKKSQVPDAPSEVSDNASAVDEASEKAPEETEDGEDEFEKLVSGFYRGNPVNKKNEDNDGE